jgi:hypothetical protein
LIISSTEFLAAFVARVANDGMTRPIAELRDECDGTEGAEQRAERAQGPSEGALAGRMRKADDAEAHEHHAPDAEDHEASSVLDREFAAARGAPVRERRSL